MSLLPKVNLLLLFIISSRYCILLFKLFIIFVFLASEISFCFLIFSNSFSNLFTFEIKSLIYEGIFVLISNELKLFIFSYSFK